jgi:ATPase subunit of ABC transporter with duplicated ATPase domains
VEFNNSSTASLERIRDSIVNLEETAKSDDPISYLTVNGKPVGVGSEELKGLIRLDHISTFDQPLFPLEVLQRRTGEDGETYLDFLIEKLEKKYLNYQIDIGKRALEALSSGGATEVSSIRQRIDSKKLLFLELMDDLFSHTQKRIDRQVNGISFLNSPKQVISPYHLSSGEKQMLIILLTALVQDNQPAVMILDEPELSLHTDWQERLIDDIRKLNGHVQIIIATHSPSIIIHGWQDKVFETVDIQIKK